MGITEQGVMYNGDLCSSCSKWIHKALMPIHDYYCVSDWVCIRCSPMTLDEYDRLMSKIPKNFREEATPKQISDFRKLLKKLEKKN